QMPQPDAGRAAGQDAIGDGDTLADAVGFGDAGEGQRIVAPPDDAIGHYDILRSGEMNAVVVRHLQVVVDPDSVHLDVLTTAEGDGPTGRISYGHPFETEVAAIMEEDGLVGAVARGD